MSRGKLEVVGLRGIEPRSTGYEPDASANMLEARIKNRNVLSQGLRAYYLLM